MNRFLFVIIFSTIILAGCSPDAQPLLTINSDWQEEFGIDECTMVTTGENPYFILDPGFTLVLENSTEKVIITVLDETAVIDGVETRLIEEREWRNDELIEISINMFAMCEETQDVFYFGEYVDMYSGGELTSHQGQWFSGEDDARAGMIMPGEPKIGMRYYQEIAPGVAMDRAHITSTDVTLTTPAGEFTDCLETIEGTALNLAEREIKIYAPGIGLIQDANLFLTDYGYLNN